MLTTIIHLNMHVMSQKTNVLYTERIRRTIDNTNELKLNNVKTIYTVIPFFYDNIEIFQNDVKSFKSFNEAELYAFNEIDGKNYEIIENKLK